MLYEVITPYQWGGTWVGAFKGTKNAAAAKDFIKYITSDDGFMEKWAKDTGDMISNTAIVDKIKDTYSEPFLGGQNHYAAFAEMAKSVNGKLIQGTDQAVEGLFNEAVRITSYNVCYTKLLREWPWPPFLYRYRSHLESG